MKTTVTIHDFREAFQRMGRADNFSYDGLTALFRYLEDIEDSTGEEIELDVIALCCDYSEETVQRIAEAYDVEAVEGQTLEDAVVEFLTDAGAFVAKTTTGTIVFWNQ